MRHLLLAILLVIPIAAATQDTCPHGCQPTEDRTKVQEEQRAQGWTTAHSAESEHWRGVYHHLRKGDRIHALVANAARRAPKGLAVDAREVTAWADQALTSLLQARLAASVTKQFDGFTVKAGLVQYTTCTCACAGVCQGRARKAVGAFIGIRPLSAAAESVSQRRKLLATSNCIIVKNTCTAIDYEVSVGFLSAPSTWSASGWMQLSRDEHAVCAPSSYPTPYVYAYFKATGFGNSKEKDSDIAGSVDWKEGSFCMRRDGAPFLVSRYYASKEPVRIWDELQPSLGSGSTCGRMGSAYWAVRYMRMPAADTLEVTCGSKDLLPEASTGALDLYCQRASVPEAITLINTLRTRNPAAFALQCHEGLAKEATKWAVDMCERDGLDGAVDSAAMCNTAVLGELRPWTWCAIGSQYVSSATLGATPIVDRWSKSPQHISTMMSEMGTHVGLGYHVCGNGRTYWGQIMIRKPVAADAPLVSAVAATVPEGTLCSDVANVGALAVTNSIRDTQSLPHIACHEGLSRKARNQAQLMCRNQSLDHPNMNARCTAAMGSTQKWQSCGENCQYNDYTGPGMGERTVAQWWAGVDHFANMVQRTSTHAGIGYFECQGRTYWTQLVAGIGKK